MTSNPGQSVKSLLSARVRPRVREADRKRAVQACWRCRNRKSRCIIASANRPRPTCKRCLKDGVECAFGNYFLSAAAPEQLSQDESPQGSSTSPMTTTPYLGVQSLHGRHTSEVPTSAAGSTDRDPQNSTRTRHQLAHLVVKNPHQTHFVGEISNGTFISEVQDAVVSSSPHSTREDNRISSDFTQSLDSNITDPELLKGALAGFPPKSVADFLISVFFHVVEANYYYMDRTAFVERLSRCYEKLSPESVDFDAGFVCLALMAFAMGSQFADIRAPTEATLSTTMSKHGPGAVFYMKTKPLLSDLITRCSLESIQVCFLIGLFLLPTNTSDLSYVYHGMAVKMAISAGLHRKVRNTNLSQRVLHVRNRLWWSLYTSERRLTIILDRPETIREEDTDTPFPDSNDDLDLPHCDNVSHLQASIKLTRLYNRTVRLGKRLDFTDKDAQREITEIRHDLDQWVRDLPSRLQLSGLQPESKSFRGAVHLHMTSHQVVVYMGRAALLRRIQRRLHRQKVTTDASEPENMKPPEEKTEEGLARECVAAAYKIIDLLRFLYLSKKLARYSFTDINCCSSAAIIVIINEIICPHPSYDPALSSIMQCLKHMATGCQNARHGLRLVQNLLVLVAAAMRGAEPSSHEIAGPELNIEQHTQTRRYNEWASWMRSVETTAGGQPNLRSSVIASSGTSGHERQEWQEHSDLSHSHPSYGEHAMSLEGMGGFSGTAFSPSQVDPKLIYSWPDSLNFLGLSAFEGLEFPVNLMEQLS